MTTSSPPDRSWTSFWDGPNRIYVNDVHLHAHYAKIAKDVAEFVDGKTQLLLDFGCGEALAAPDMAALGLNLVLYDAAAPVRQRLAQRYANIQAIRVLQQEEWDGSHPPEWVDLLLVNSVIQYLPREAFEALLPRFHRLLSKRGRLIIADVIPPDASIAGDIAALLRPAVRHGFLMAALSGLAATFFSDYRKLRREVGLTSYRADEMVALLARHGFVAEKQWKNIGFHQSRMTFVARVAD